MNVLPVSISQKLEAVERYPYVKNVCAKASERFYAQIMMLE